jgi:hypothetical protein
MRESAAPDRPLGGLTAAGAALLAIGAVMLALKLTGTVSGATGLLLGGGALLGFLGVAMLAPAISRPVTNTLGRLVSFTIPGRLGTRNTGRNPRRTAITASALMIGVALATGAGIFATSAKAGITDSFRSDLTAQLIVGPEVTADRRPGRFSIRPGRTDGRDPRGVGRARPADRRGVPQRNTTTMAAGDVAPRARSSRCSPPPANCAPETRRARRRRADRDRAGLPARRRADHAHGTRR